MEDNGNNPKYIKMLKAAELRSQKLKNSKEARKEPITVSAVQLADFSGHPILVYQPDVEDVRKMAVVVDNNPYCSNLGLFQHEQPKKYFMFDRSDPGCSNLMSMIDIDEGVLENFSDLPTFTRQTHSKFVIRVLRFDGFDDFPYIFADELLEMIPLALQERNAWNKNHKQMHASLQKSWRPRKTYHCNLLHLSDLHQAIKDFRIHKSLITIIRDPVLDQTTHETFHNSSAPIYSLSPNAKEVMTQETARFYVFQSVICGIDWHTEKCKENQQALNDFEEIFNIDVMKNRLSVIGHETLFTKEFVDQQIAMLKSHQIFTENIVHQTTDYLLDGLKPEDNITREMHKTILEDLGFPNFSFYFSETPSIEVWMARRFYIFHAIQSFYHELEVVVKKVFVDELCSKIPLPVRNHQREIMYKEIETAKRKGILTAKNLNGHAFANSFPSSLLNLNLRRTRKEKHNKSGTTNEKMKKQYSKPVDAEVLDKEHLKPKEQGKEMNGPKDSKKSEQNEQKKELFSDASNRNNDANQLPIIHESAEDCQEKHIVSSKSTPDQTHRLLKEGVEAEMTVSPMTKSTQRNLEVCAETCEKCTASGKELEEADYKCKELETKLRKTEKEFDLAKKASGKQSEELELVKKSMEEQTRELEKLKEKLNKSTATIENRRGETKNLRLQNEKMTKEVESMNQKMFQAQEEISHLNQKLEDVQYNLALNQSQLEKETEENSQMVAELQQKVHDLSVRSVQSTSSGANSPLKTLEEWLKFKDDFVEQKLVKDAEHTTQRLKTMTTELDIEELCVFELQQFKISANIYIDAINLNISKLGKGYDPSELLPLPGLPKLSKKFQLANVKELKRQSALEAAQAHAASRVTAETGFDPKLTCYICYHDFCQGNRIWACKKCGVPTCIQCHLSWKKAQKSLNVMKEACGYCRQMMQEENKQQRRK